MPTLYSMAAHLRERVCSRECGRNATCKLFAAGDGCRELEISLFATPRIGSSSSSRCASWTSSAAAGPALTALCLSDRGLDAWGPTLPHWPDPHTAVVTLANQGLRTDVIVNAHKFDIGLRLPV